MLKKIFQLVISNFFFEAKLGLSVCIPAFSFNLIMPVYPSPNFLTFNLVSTIQFKIILLSNCCLQFFLFIFSWIYYIFFPVSLSLFFRSFFFDLFYLFSKFFFNPSFSILLFRSFFSLSFLRSFYLFLILLF